MLFNIKNQRPQLSISCCVLGFTLKVAVQATWHNLSCMAVLVSCFAGCSRDSPQVAESQKSRCIVEHVSRSKLRDVVDKAGRCLDSVYGARLPETCPDWVALHAVLMHGDLAYDAFIFGEADANLARAFTIALNTHGHQGGLFEVRNGRPYSRRRGLRFSVEGHPSQFLTYFSMAGGSPSATFFADGKMFSVDELIHASMLEANLEVELSYTVSAFSYYLEPGRVWENKFGESMSLARLAGKLLRQREAACMGTHRLAALARISAKDSLKSKSDISAILLELEKEIDSALNNLKTSQRPDGTFVSPEAAPCSQAQPYQDIYFTGHSLEWITLLESRCAKEEWVVRAIEALIILINKTHENIYRNLDGVGTEAAFFDFDGLAHAVSAVRRWRDIVEFEFANDTVERRSKPTN